MMAESTTGAVPHGVPFSHNLVNGIVFSSFVSQQRVDELKVFKLRPDDVFVASYPKSGEAGISDSGGGLQIQLVFNDLLTCGCLKQLASEKGSWAGELCMLAVSLHCSTGK